MIKSNHLKNNLNNLTISMLARETELSIETIRYYQRKGLLAKPNTSNGRSRRYDAESIKRLEFVKSAKQIGFSLNEVADLLKFNENVNCNEVQMLAVKKLEEIRKKLINFHCIESHLERMIKDCDSNIKNDTCPLITELNY